MGFIEAVKSVFSKYATFSGRARRSEYWYFVLFNTAIGLVFSTILRSISDTSSGLYTVLSLIYSLYTLGTLVPALAVLWRRLHDMGKSGGYAFFVLIPLVGMILLLVWLCQDSVPGDNFYGPNPKEDVLF